MSSGHRGKGRDGTLGFKPATENTLSHNLPRCGWMPSPPPAPLPPPPLCEGGGGVEISFDSELHREINRSLILYP